DAAAAIVVNEVAELRCVVCDATAAEYAAAGIRVGYRRLHVHAVQHAKLELARRRARLLDAERHERRRPGIFVSRRVKVPAATSGLVIVGDSAPQRLVAFVDTVEASDLRLGEGKNGAAGNGLRHCGHTRHHWTGHGRRDATGDL